MLLIYFLYIWLGINYAIDVHIIAEVELLPSIHGFRSYNCSIPSNVKEQVANKTKTHSAYSGSPTVYSLLLMLVKEKLRDF